MWNISPHHISSLDSWLTPGKLSLVSPLKLSVDLPYRKATILLGSKVGPHDGLYQNPVGHHDVLHVCPFSDTHILFMKYWTQPGPAIVCLKQLILTPRNSRPKIHNFGYDITYMICMSVSMSVSISISDAILSSLSHRKLLVESPIISWFVLEPDQTPVNPVQNAVHPLVILLGAENVQFLMCFSWVCPYTIHI